MELEVPPAEWAGAMAEEPAVDAGKVEHVPAVRQAAHGLTRLEVLQAHRAAEALPAGVHVVLRRDDDPRNLVDGGHGHALGPARLEDVQHLVERCVDRAHLQSRNSEIVSRMGGGRERERGFWSPFKYLIG